MAILLLLTVAGFALFSPAVTDWPLWGHEAKLRSLTLIGFVGVGIPAVFGIALVESQVRKRIARPCEDEDLDDAIKAHREIVQLLFTAGVAIGLAVLATGALRAAVVPDFVSESTFPEVYVLLFGAFFSGLLLLVYAPAYISLRRFAVRIRDGFFPRSSRPRPDADSFKEWLEKRAALEELLQMNVAARQQLETGLFILTPLLSGIIGAFVPGG